MDAPLLWDEVDNGVRRLGLALGAVRVPKAEDVPADLNNGELESVADAEEGLVPGPAVLYGADLAEGAPLPESAWDYDAVESGEDLDPLRVLLELLGLYPVYLNPAPRGRRGVSERLVDAHVAVREFGVLAAHRDADPLGGVHEPVYHLLPLPKVRVRLAQAEVLGDHVPHPCPSSTSGSS